MKRIVLAGLGLFALLLTGATPAEKPVDLARLMDATPAPTLDAYGLFQDAGARTPTASLTPYALNSPLFSDYAEKLRFVYLPPGGKAQYRPTGVLEFPVGTTIVKTFAYPADFRHPDKDLRYVETRLLIRRTSGWVPLDYVWNKEQTSAVLKRAGARFDVAFTNTAGKPVSFSYSAPNANQCKECHALSETLTPIGPKARNLNGDFAYASGPENQLAHWTKAGLLEGAPALDTIPATPHWGDEKTPLKARALAYLDANCAHCHNAKGTANNSGLYLDLEQQSVVNRGIGKRPVAAGRGAGGLDFDISPGHPEQSIMLHRMASREPGVMMPELGRGLVHDEGVALITAYIAAMDKEAAR
ncbi:hypothetical protein BH09PSE2_BH09PSE2_07310 [soil metagenome]